MAGAWEEMIFEVLPIQTILAFSDLWLEAPLAQKQRMSGPKNQTDKRRDAPPKEALRVHHEGFSPHKKKGSMGWVQFNPGWIGHFCAEAEM